MGTSCKLVFGYTDHTGWWNETNCFYRHYDGYTEAVIPLLKEYKADIYAMNSSAEYEGHKWEKLANIHDGVNGVDFIYYVDIDNFHVKVLELDMEFYQKFGIDNYKLKMECELLSMV